jgi:hypothetical protein
MLDNVLDFAFTLLWVVGWIGASALVGAGVLGAVRVLRR